MGSNQPAYESAEDLMNVFWPDPQQLGDSSQAVVTRGQIKALLVTAHHAGQDHVIHTTIDNMNTMRWSRDNSAQTVWDTIPPEKLVHVPVRCDECGAPLDPRSASSWVSVEHETSCSLHPDNVH